jgi:type IV secretory pathway VirB2 component (pilin)
MTTLILITPYLAFGCGVAMMARALHLYSKCRPQTAEGNQRKLALLVLTALAMPTLAHAQAVDLREATERGNAIIMYLSGTFAAVGIVAAGVAMMMGRQSIAKWAFAGAMVSGLAFAIVRTMWSNMGLEAAGVSSFAP